MPQTEYHIYFYAATQDILFFITLTITQDIGKLRVSFVPFLE